MRNNVLLGIAEDKFLLDRAPLLSEILPLHWPDNELTGQMSGEFPGNQYAGSGASHPAKFAY